MINATEVIDRLRPESNVPALRSLRREISAEIAGEARGPVVTLALELIAHGTAARFIAYELILHHRSATAGLTAKEVEALGMGMSAWPEVDCFGCYIAGPSWREGRISDRVVGRWAQSSDVWWRRAALVSTVPLNLRASGGRGDAVRTLAMCERLVHDCEDMVVKALSWALRALAVRDPQAVRDWMAAHDADLAARVRREVRNKLETGLKNPAISAPRSPRRPGLPPSPLAALPEECPKVRIRRVREH